ncbi:redoxin domain-containing protein [Desulfogranum marinum]|uniref:redoxin domain-containing protein n=1 Tax=Desulfogranum marinum TaxID=453220 RepID=UPI0019656794|nr:redoxin domain-containing protein [Desulfogranum marinum]MBM9512255.1 redoxin domain-containing protein [Desulfogranum marinum]
MTLQEKLSAMKKESMATRPPEVVATLLQEVENLIQAGIADNALKVGETLPDFSLPDEKGQLVSSKDLLSKGPLAINFYRGIW